ncbi:MAG: DUF2207 domain-containing protein, partial [Acidimicrobiia bacterium]|nr:DUF2207 domain-containing protein [Acidimicrobiia bacterium]
MALGAGLGVPVATANLSSSTGSVYEPTTIRSYVADFDVEADGDLAVTETLTVDFPVTDRHGIFRFWDVKDPNNANTRLVPENIAVTRDGQPDEVQMSEQKGGRYRVARIGQADVTLPTGNHVYKISFTIPGVLVPGKDGHPTRFNWNLIPGGWQQEIDSAQLTVHLPGPSAGGQCFIGAGFGGPPCSVQGDGTDTLTVQASGLPAFTPVTIDAPLDIPTPSPGRTVPWPLRFDNALGDSLPGAAGSLAAALGLGGLGLVAGRRTREDQPGFPLQYGPPAGIGPAQATYILDEEVGANAFVASVMLAAEHGAVTLTQAEDAWAITDARGPEGWAGLDPVTTRIGRLVGGPGGTFWAQRSNVAAGNKLKTEIAGFNGDIKS